MVGFITIKTARDALFSATQGWLLCPWLTSGSLLWLPNGCGCGDFNWMQPTTWSDAVDKSALEEVVPGVHKTFHAFMSLTQSTKLLICLCTLLMTIPCLADPTRLQQTIVELSTHGSRMAGYSGDTYAAGYVQEQFAAAGVQKIQRDPFLVTVPIDKGASLHLLADGTDLLTDGAVLPLWSLWPNLVRTSTVPREGIESELIYGGHGLYEDLEGHKVDGQVVLMEFNSAHRWRTPASLGARAIVFIAPDETTIKETRDKWSIAPVNMPRFWIEAEAGKRLKDRLRQETVRIRLKARMDWEQHTTQNIWGVVPGTDPQLQNELVVVSAYYDGTSVVPGLTPSAESAVSIAALIEFAHYLREHPPGRSVLLLATGAHFVRKAGIVDFVNRYARKVPLFRARMSCDLDISLFIGLDLSSHSDRVALWNTKQEPRFPRFFLPMARNFMAYEKQIQQGGQGPGRASLINGISPPRGRTIESYFSGGEATTEGTVARNVGLLALELRTADDPRLRLDSPLDQAPFVDIERLHGQSELINELLLCALGDRQLYGHNEADLRSGHEQNIPDQLKSIRGSLRELPAPGSSAVTGIRHGIAALVPDLERFWRPWVTLADKKGSYRLSGMPPMTVGLHGYLVDSATGAVTYATDRGEQAQKLGLIEQALVADETAWTTIMFAAKQIDLYERVSAQRFFTMGDRDTQVLDKRGTTPRRFGYSASHTEEMALFGTPGDSLRLVDGSIVLLNNEAATAREEARGRGFATIGQGLIRHVTLQSATDLWNLNESRLWQMRKYAIENPLVERLHETAGNLIAAAKQARDNQEWARYARFAREALGMEYRAYPEVKGTQNDVVSGLVFFVGLLLPAVFFLEKLIFASTDIHRQLVGLGGTFLVSWVLLSLVHPAFDLASPLVILLSLFICATGAFVMALLVSRFNSFMMARRMRRVGTDVTQMSRSGALYAAFALGISNMRRRALRTNLTLATITLLTFTVLSFTSFVPGITTLSVPAERDAAYPGVLLQDPYWWPWDDPAIDYIRSHFAETSTVVARTWRFNHEDVEGAIPISASGNKAQADAVLGLDPQEPRVTGIDRSLLQGSWFEEEGERSVIISQMLARELAPATDTRHAEGVGIGDVVEFFGTQWRVRGIFDADLFEQIHDLNDESLTPVREEYNALMTPGLEVDRQQGETEFEQLGVAMQFGHLPAQRLIIVPHRRLAAIGARDYTIAVRFNDDVDGESLIKRFLARTSFTLWAGVPDDVGQLRAWSYTSIGVTSIQGLGALIMPAILAALIVLNTMMGSVYERFREIGVYSSVGLAPTHISFLFLAEACVYAVLGVVFGYLLGQGTGKVLMGFDLLSGVSLNYSSTAAVASATIVIALVLLSAIYPAVAASRIAVPDVVRRWLIPAAEGDVMRFIFPFTVNATNVDSLSGFLYSQFASYSDESVGGLYTEQTRIVKRQTAAGEIRSVQLGLWLAPFDLGVSQYLEISVYPSETQGIHEVEIYIERLGGPMAHWHRLNQDFAIKLRRQFLIWQTMGEDLRQEHAQTARQVVAPAEVLA